MSELVYYARHAIIGPFLKMFYENKIIAQDYDKINSTKGIENTQICSNFGRDIHNWGCM